MPVSVLNRISPVEAFKLPKLPVLEIGSVDAWVTMVVEKKRNDAVASEKELED